MRAFGNAHALPRAPALAAWFLTPWSWIGHATVWAVGMLAVNQILSVIHLAGPVTLFALLGACVAAFLLSPAERAASVAQAARFAVVDSVFLGLALGLLFPLVLLPLRAAGWLRPTSEMPIEYASTSALFVLQFYLFLGAAGALRGWARPWSFAPALAGGLAALGLAASVWQQAAAHLDHRRAVARKQAVYERETGRSARPLEAEIALSLHGFYGRPNDLLVDSRGRVVVAGEFTLYAGHAAHGLVRLAPDASIDASLRLHGFDASLRRGHERVRLLADDALLVDAPQRAAGRESPLVLRKLQPDGRLDERMQVPVGEWMPSLMQHRLDPFDAQADGQVLIGRYGPVAQGGDPACVRRVLPDGSADAAFARALGTALDARNAQPAHSCTVTEVVALPSGQALVRLSWRDDDGAWREDGLRRLNADGSLDRAFQPALTGVRAIAVASDGALLVTSLSTATQTQPLSFSLLRLRGDGTLDPAFAVPAGSFAHIDALAAGPGGTVLVAGRRPGSALDLGVFRLLPDGRVDPSFGEAGRVAVNGFVRRMVLAPGGATYLLGDFVDVGSGDKRLPRYQIARLGPDGTPDPAFDPR